MRRKEVEPELITYNAVPWLHLAAGEMDFMGAPWGHHAEKGDFWEWPTRINMNIHEMLYGVYIYIIINIWYILSTDLCVVLICCFVFFLTWSIQIHSHSIKTSRPPTTRTMMMLTIKLGGPRVLFFDKPSAPGRIVSWRGWSGLGWDYWGTVRWKSVWGPIFRAKG